MCAAYSKAEQYAKNITTGSVVSSWHERNLKHSLQHVGVKDCLTTGPDITIPGKASSIQAQCQDEVQQANRTVMAMRKARLAELYQRDHVQYEQELRSMGLALSKNMD